MPQQEVDDRTFGDKIADRVTAWGGSWKAIFAGVAFLTLWTTTNICLSAAAFDPYPFILLNLFLSMVAAFQAPFIMMSQNRSERKQDEAYRRLLGEIKQLVQIDIKLEKKILKVLAEQSRRNDPPVQ